MILDPAGHIRIAVLDLRNSMFFYGALFEKLGYIQVREEAWVTPHGLGFWLIQAEDLSQKHMHGTPGLHHFCFRARERSDIDQIYQFLLEMKTKIVHPPEEGPWGPGYYSVLFEDPDGIRIEVNHAPGRGVLEEGKSFNPAGDYK